MKTIFILAALMTGCLTGPGDCTNEVRTVYIRMKWVSYGTYEKTVYNSYSDCSRDITPNSGKPHYCKSDEQIVEVCK